MNTYLSYFQDRVRCKIHKAVDQKAGPVARLSETQFPSNKKSTYENYIHLIYFVYDLLLLVSRTTAGNTLECIKKADYSVKPHPYYRHPPAERHSLMWSLLALKPCSV